MQFKDLGIILSVKKYGEDSLIIKILSQNHGMRPAFVNKGLKNNKTRNFYQIGNLVEFTWQAKNENGLGFCAVELVQSFLASILFDRIKLNCLNSIVEIIRENILEGEPQIKLFILLLNFLQNANLKNSAFLKNHIKLEIELLQILGYGIDLTRCAASGVVTNLIYVSPKSGRAVSGEAGKDYANRLLILPQFLLKGQQENADIVSKDELLHGLKLSGFFLKKYLYRQDHSGSKKNSDIPVSRIHLLNLVENSLA